VDRSDEIELLSECLELAKTKQPFMTGEETLVPVAKYIGEGRFLRELSLLSHTPNLVAHTSRLASPGDFLTRDVGATPVLLVRGEGGEVNAFINVCRHRGATIETMPSGRCTRFVCPYHAWTYRTDGRLDRVRHREGFPSLDNEETSLVRLPCFEASGFVWVTPSVDGASSGLPSALADELRWLDCEHLEVLDTESRVWKANWKLIVDGGLESYHFKIAHRDTIAGLFLDNVSTFEFLNDHIRSVLPRASVLSLEGKPKSEWSLRKHANVLYSLFPNASLLVQEDHVVLIIMTPLSVAETRIELASLVPARPRSERADEYFRANHAFTIKTLDEDFAIAERIQRGAATGANEHYRFARFEAALSRWHRQLDEKLAVIGRRDS